VVSEATGRFVAIPTAYVRDEGISPKAKLLGVVLGSYANKDGIAWPGLNTLQRETGLGRDGIKKARRELREKGLIRPVRTRGQAGRFGKIKYFISPKVLHRRKKDEIQLHGMPPRDHHSTENPSAGPTADGPPSS
jgi:Helix-turn-helix domain